MLKRYAFGVGFVAWMITITVLSLVSFEDDLAPDIEIPYLDKVVHFSFYFIAAVLGMSFIHAQNQQFSSARKRTLILLSSLLIYGIIIEVLQQSLTTYRSGEILDVLANSIGALLGTLLMWAIFSEKTGLKWKN
ncbi:MAG: VanZ family protein [Flavobacteriaceae bacterium]|nr:VanZ family protein [Muriicola sp.]NNC60720.1 VanZ family protein [Eudoraea sp.]NNL38440.1 VanZ family protein [Flavobacteriaceae bacterium]